MIQWRIGNHRLVFWWHGTVVLGLVALCAVASAAGQTETPIAVGDLVFVDVYRRAELCTTTQVDANGNITLPYVGNVKVVGLTEKDASARVSAALKKILKNPRVTVSRTVRRMALGARTAEMETQVVNLNNANAEALYEALQGMSSEGGNIGFDPNTNSLIVTDTPGTVQNMLSVIAQLDEMQIQVTQVRIETKIAEVNQGAMKELGIRWFAQGDEVTGGYYPVGSQDPAIAGIRGQTGVMANEELSSGWGGSSGGGRGVGREFVEGLDFDRRLAVPVHVPIAGQMFFGLLNRHVDIGVLLDALVADKKAETLATPMILAVNHRPAEIKMTDEYPFSEYIMGSYGARTSIRFMDLGIKMEVTPHVYRDAGGLYVQLELLPEVSWYKGMSSGVPIRAVRSSHTITNVRDGQTLVIGGIVLSEERNVDHRVPGVGRVPIVGSLFKHKERARERKELMVFVTPSVHERPESITWDKMLNLSVATEPQAPMIPSLEARSETRRD